MMRVDDIITYIFLLYIHSKKFFELALQIAARIFANSGLVKKFAIPRDEFMSYFHALEVGYRESNACECTQLQAFILFFFSPSSYLSGSRYSLLALKSACRHFYRG